jgi:hypothetical protein
MKSRLWDIIKFLRLGALVLSIHPRSALRQLGWFKSFHRRKVIDNIGNPIPWWTYSFIDFIEDRLTNEMRILEFGCGGSTIFLYNRVGQVISFEDNADWAAKTSEQIQSGFSKIFYIDNISDFSSYSNKIEGKFDILIIDNLGNRMDCAINNIKYLKDDGVVIWDNTDGPDWESIKSFMINHDFKEISFTGMVAQEISYNKTTLFYRSKNCLNI